MLQQVKICGRGHLRTPENMRKSGACKLCDVAYREANRDTLRAKNIAYYRKAGQSFRDASRNNRLKREYGVDSKWYAGKFAEQGGVCAICSRPQEEGIKSLAVDHDHETKQVRGLLCRACNRGLGIFQDDIARLEAAMAYLKRFR